MNPIEVSLQSPSHPEGQIKAWVWITKSTRKWLISVGKGHHPTALIRGEIESWADEMGWEVKSLKTVGVTEGTCYIL